MIEEIAGDLLQWLRGFYFVAKKGTVTQAAAMMGREQPTITRQIKCLERELGAKLFDRSFGKMTLTPEGKTLLEKAISLLEDVREMRNLFREGKLQYSGKIVIASGHTIIDSFLPRYIARFRDIHPRVTFHMEGGNVEMILEKVESAEADFGIAYVESVPDTIAYHELFETGMKLIVPKNNPFSLGRSSTLREIAQAPLILFSHMGLVESFIEKRFAKDRLKPNIVMTHNNIVSVKKYVALGLGVSILSGYAISTEDRKMIDSFPLDRYFPKRKYGLLLRKRKYLSPAVKAFIRTIKPDIQFTR